MVVGIEDATAKRERKHFYFRKQLTLGLNDDEYNAGNMYLPQQLIAICTCGFSQVKVDHMKNDKYYVEETELYKRNGISSECPECGAKVPGRNESYVLTGLYFEEQNGNVSLAYHGYNFVPLGIEMGQTNSQFYSMDRCAVKRFHIAAINFSHRITVDPKKNEIYFLDRKTKKVKIQKGGFEQVYTDMAAFQYVMESEEETFQAFIRRSLEAVGVHETVIEDVLQSKYPAVLLQKLITFIKYPALSEINGKIAITGNITEDERKGLKAATTRSEAIRVLIPAISKKGMARWERLWKVGTEGHLQFKLFSNKSYLNDYMALLEQEEVTEFPWGRNKVLLTTPGKMDVHDDTGGKRVDLYTDHSIKEFRSAFFKEPTSMDRALIRHYKESGKSNHDNRELESLLRDTFRMWTTIRRNLRKEKGAKAEFMAKEFFQKKHSITEIHDFLSVELNKIVEKERDFEYTDDQRRQCNWTDSTGQYRFELPKSNHTLQEVGSALSICVGSYASMVYAKQTLIVNVFDATTDKPVYCIQLRDKAIVQAKLKYNQVAQLSDHLLLQALTDYMKQKGLFADCYDLQVLTEFKEATNSTLYAAC